MINSKKARNRRYYLHRRVKSFAKVYAKSRQIDVPFGSEEEWNELQKKWINALTEFGYNIQLTVT